MRPRQVRADTTVTWRLSVRSDDRCLLDHRSFVVRSRSVFTGLREAVYIPNSYELLERNPID